VRTKIKQCSLIVCLFIFLFVVIGGGLHLSPGGAFIAAATGTPLLIYMFNRRLARERIEPDLWPPRKTHPTARDAPPEFRSREAEDIARH
jgi:multisubunit Na+/H+ antiporter MnhB subunit